MSWGDPLWLWGLAATPLLAGLLLWGAVARRRRLGAFARPATAARILTVSAGTRRTVRAALIVLAVVFMIAALARPRWGTSLEPIETRGVDVILAVDAHALLAGPAEAADGLRLDRRRAVASSAELEPHVAPLAARLLHHDVVPSGGGDDATVGERHPRVRDGAGRRQDQNEREKRGAGGHRRPSDGKGLDVSIDGRERPGFRD